MCLPGKLPWRQWPSKEPRTLLTKQPCCLMGHPPHKGVVDVGGHEVDREALPCGVHPRNSIP